MIRKMFGYQNYPGGYKIPIVKVLFILSSVPKIRCLWQLQTYIFLYKNFIVYHQNASQLKILMGTFFLMLDLFQHLYVLQQAAHKISWNARVFSVVKGILLTAKYLISQSIGTSETRSIRISKNMQLNHTLTWPVRNKEC